MVYCRLGFGTFIGNMHRLTNKASDQNSFVVGQHGDTFECMRESASKSEKKMQGGAYQRAVLLKSPPERAHPRPCNQKMHPKKFFLNVEFFMLLG